MKRKVLMIGNVPSNDYRSVGGANTYTLELLSILRGSKELSLNFMKIRKRWYKYGQVIDYTFLPFKFIFSFRKYDVISIHATWDFHITVGPLLVLISKLFKKKVIYHFFGGKFHEIYDSYPSLIKKYLDSTILKSDYKLMETKRMISYFSKDKRRNFVWFPNSRQAENKQESFKKFSKKFVFISRVTPNKGVNEIIEAMKFLPDNYTIDIYGPIDFDSYDVSFKEKKFYKGSLLPEEVVSTLKAYDVLILPTYHPGEGYPGIFIEAMSIGMPIISTRWNALDELIDDGYNGKLISIKSIEELVDAIMFFNDDNYHDMKKNALTKFKDFDIKFVSKKLIKLYLC